MTRYFSAKWPEFGFCEVDDNLLATVESVPVRFSNYKQYKSCYDYHTVKRDELEPYEELVVGLQHDPVDKPARYNSGGVETSEKSDGGPSSYYDQPYSDWQTTNDQMEWLAENKWGRYAIHLKDVFKGLCRWGDKEGTSVVYDTKKGIYYFCRVLRMIGGKKAVQDYLQNILNDPQFKD